MTATLNPWFIVSVGNEISLAGIVYDDTRKRVIGPQTEFDDGHRVVTSMLISINDNVATTRTGSMYLLGEMGTEELFYERNFNHFCKFESFDKVKDYEV